MPLATAIAVPETPKTFEARPPLSASRIRLDEVVLRLQEAEPAAALRQVVEVVRHLLREVVHLVDERRDEEEGDSDDRSRERRAMSRDRAAASALMPSS